MSKFWKMVLASRMHSRPLGWAHWRSTESRLPKGAVQRERWHLWQIHNQQTLDHFAEWVAETAMIAWNSTTKVEMSSEWVDCRPVAWFPSTVAPLLTTCEVGDILVIVETKRMLGRGKSERAILLQAKTSVLPNELDASTCTFPGATSTHKQRNLYEVNSAPFSIYTSGAKGAAKIGGPYLFPGWPQRSHSHMGDGARYLLIPNTQALGHGWKSWRTGLPYQTVWPEARTLQGGERIHIADLILSMAGVSRPLQGEDIRNGSDWARLTEDLLAYAGTRTVSRFSSTTDTLLTAAKAVSLAKRLKLTVIGLLTALVPLISRLTEPLRLYAVPPSRKFAADFESPEHDSGLLVLRITIRELDNVSELPPQNGTQPTQPTKDTS